MSKRVQAELAEANSVAEEALSSMTTVKAHAAEESTKAAYADRLRRFYSLQQRWGALRGNAGLRGVGLPACGGSPAGVPGETVCA
jgi:ABC-type multidrug transport system fused ATPase/permease subunit